MQTLMDREESQLNKSKRIKKAMGMFAMAFLLVLG